MTYTLLGASTLGFDLVRLDRGTQVATILLRALATTREDLPRLAEEHSGPARDERWQRALAAETANRPSGPTVGDTLPAGDAAAVLLERLRLTRLGSVAALENLIRHQILDWTWEPGEAVDGRPVTAQGYVARLAADVLVDAAAAEYGSEFLDPGLAAGLTGPFTRVHEPAETIPAEVPVATLRLLHELARLDDAGRDRLRVAVEERRPETSTWAAAMHEATWAAHLTGRVRTAAAAQLLAVRAFRASGLSPHDGAVGAWNAVSGAVQAEVVADLLSEEHAHVLTAAWKAVTDTRS